MKKKLLAILLTAAMVVCMMPAMAFAGEAPAEEAKEVAQEAQTPEEKSEEVAEAPEEQAAPAVVEEEKAEATEVKAEAKDEKAEVKEKKTEVGTELSGEWSGFEFSWDSNDVTWEMRESGVDPGVYYREEPVSKEASDTVEALNAYIITDLDIAKILEAGDKAEDMAAAAKKNVTKIKIEDGVKDFTEEVNNVFENGASLCMVVIANDGEVSAIIDSYMNNLQDPSKNYQSDADTYVNVAAFYKFDVTVKVDQAAKKDTTFTYDMPSLIATEGITYNEAAKVIKMSDFPNIPEPQKPEDLLDDYYDFAKECLGVVGKLDLDLERVDAEEYGEKIQSLANSAGLKLNAELADNTVVLEKGEKKANDYLVYRMDGELFTQSGLAELYAGENNILYIAEHAKNGKYKDTNAVDTLLNYFADTFEISLPLGMVFRETGNDGGYTVDKSVYVGTILVDDVVDQVYGLARTAYLATLKAKSEAELVKITKGFYDDMADVVRGIGFNYAKFDNMNDLDATLAKINAKYDTLGERLAAYGKLFTEDELTSMTFTHLKGVNTGDSNSLGLWLVLGLMASAATAAYVLKRRED